MAKKEHSINTAETVESEVLGNDNEGDGRSMLPALPMSATLGTVQGASTIDNLRLPRLQIAYGVGGLSEHYSPGDIVLGGDTLLAHKNEVVKAIILTATEYWKEYQSQELWASGQRPRTFLTKDEVVQAGGSVAWTNGIGPTFNLAMNIKMLIQKPKDLVSGAFGIDIGPELYAPAVWDIDKKAYAAVAPNINTAANFSLRKRSLLAGIFHISTTIVKLKNGSFVPVPSAQLKEYNSDEIVEQIRSLFANQQ